ncbi:MAG TPA: sugar transferase [Candidatus Paceibacterota bacterium]|nr:sugar transferase [Candidatus Paceibacterota bacterium]
MTFGGRYAATLLFFGDIVIFFASLWLTLLIRYGAVPSDGLLADHLFWFSILFAFWLLVFYMAGLYGKRVLLFKSSLFAVILQTQIANIVLAALFFFFVPSIGIAPKTNLLLYLIISLALVMLWRLWIFPRITRPTSRERAALIGSGPEAQELAAEVNGNARYHLSFAVLATPAELEADFAGFKQRLKEAGVSLLVVDAERDAMRPLLPKLYELAFVQPGYPFLDFHEVYEEVFDRVPLSLLEYDWFLKNLSGTGETFYLAAKRTIDIVGGLLMGLITVIGTPFVALALRLEGPGPVFITQERIGRYGERVRAYKFRSMRYSDEGKWKGEGENKVTRVGALLRLTSFDEFPQFLNVLKGDVSLIGPRNDIRALGERLGEAIPYYNMRYIVQPGITGWAQINQRYEPGNISPQSIEETKMRLAYDFYYIKNRSLALDIIIALKTVKRMLFRVAS